MKQSQSIDSQLQTLAHTLLDKWCSDAMKEFVDKDKFCNKMVEHFHVVLQALGGHNVDNEASYNIMNENLSDVINMFMPKFADQLQYKGGRYMDLCCELKDELFKVKEDELFRVKEEELSSGRALLDRIKRYAKENGLDLEKEKVSVDEANRITVAMEKLVKTYTD